MKTNPLHLFLFIPLSFLAQMLSGQNTISGIVTDKLSKTPLIGASVGIDGGLDGASTDTLGRFRFSTDETGQQNLLVSYLGYQTAKIPLDLSKPQQNLRISLQETPTDIGEVVISAGAFEASDEKKGTVLLPLDIVTIPGANGDITGALNTLTGTTVNGESGQLIVRGGAASETRIYIDGMAVRNFYTSPAPNLPVRSRFSPFQFKGTTFASGGYSAEYGQALSSTLILNTPDWPTQGGMNVGISSIGLDMGQTFIKQRHALSANVSYFNLSPYMSLIKQDIEFPTAPQGGSANVEGRIKSGELGIIKYGGQATFNKVSIAYPRAPFETDAFSMSIANRNTRAYASWRQPVGDAWTLYAAGQFEANHDDFTPNTFSPFTIQNRAASGRFNATWSPNNRLRWRNGSEYNWVTIDSDFYPDPFKQTTAAVYSEVETYAGERMVVRAGLRGERDFFLEKNNLAPRLSAAFKTGRDAQISASWGLFYQSPVDSLLFRTAQLGFERAEHYILNYQVTRNGRIFRLEGFYKKYNDLVRTAPVFDNSGNGYAQGVELFFRDRKSLQWGDYWISYSLLDTRRLHRAYPVSAMPEFAARHNASVVFKYFFLKQQLSTSMSYTVQTGRPYFNPENPVFLGDRTPTYHNLSLQVAKLTSIFDNFTVLVVSVNNALWLKQVYSYRYSAIPTTNPTEYYRQEIVPPARGFIFVGAFVNIGDKRKTVTKEEALE